MKKIVFLLITQIVFSQTLIINIDEDKFGVDSTNSIIVSQINNIVNYNDLSSYTEININFNNDSYYFQNIPSSLQYSDSYIVIKNNLEYRLFFTQLPLISINTTNTIVDEPKVNASFTYSDNEQIIDSYIGVEIRGASSQLFPKKSYDIEFWDDENGEETNNFQIGNLRNDDDWVLDGIYNEPLRIRSYIAYKYWLNMHNPHYLTTEPNAKSGVDIMYVEIFLNNLYNGVYLLSEQIDRKQLKLKKYNDNIRGELYKAFSFGGGPRYTFLINYDNNSRSWNGYDYKYPKADEATNWELVYNFVDFVINTTDEDFNANIWNKFNKENAIDYFIFINFLRARDNVAKNIHLCKYNKDYPYFNTPWDLDMIWGNNWDGSIDSEIDDLMTNGLYNRLLNTNSNVFINDLIAKWNLYRSNLLSLETIENNIDLPYHYLLENNIYERETLVYPSHDFDDISRNFISYRLENRLEYMDNFIETLNTDRYELNSFKIYPSPSNDFLIITSEDFINKNYIIYSFNGLEIQQGKINSENKIDINKLNSGIYLILINGFYSKIVKN